MAVMYGHESTTKAIQLAPNYAMAYNNRAAAHIQLKHFEDSIRDASEAIRLDSRLALAYYNRGIARWKRAALRQYLGGMNDAIDDLDSSLKLDPKNILFSQCLAEGLVDRARFQAEKNSSAALADLDRALSINPNDGNAHCLRGWLLHSLGRNEEATQAFSNAIACDEKNGIAYYDRSFCYQQLGLLDNAKRDLERARQLGVQADDQTDTSH